VNYLSCFRSQMGILFYIIPVIQILNVIHVIKSGRSWSWLWLVLAFPLVGTAIYVLMELLPGFRFHSVSGLFESIFNILKPGSELEKLKEKLETCDSVENKKALGDYYLRKAEPFKAVEIYKGCLQGAYKNDDFLSLFLCRSLFEAKLYEEAKANLIKLKGQSPNYEKNKVDLLFAKIHEAFNEDLEALGIYEKLAEQYGEGEEPRCRLALLLEKMGQKDRAILIYKDIVKRSKKFFPNYRRTEKEWINTSRMNLKRLKKKEDKGTVILL